MEGKSPERRSNTNNNVIPGLNEEAKAEENDENFKPMEMQRKGKTTTLKTFLNDDLKKIAEVASKKNGY